VAVFTLLLLGGIGAPIPEDIPLLLAGVAGRKEIVELHSIFLTSYLGVIVADQFVYFIGYFFGQRILSAGTRSTFFPAITEERICEIREGLRKRRLFYIFLGRHLFPVRTVTFLTAGALRIPYFEFLLSDAFAALVSVTLVLGVGYYLGGSLTPEVIHSIAEEMHIVIIGVVAFCALLWLLKRMVWKSRQEPCLAEEIKFTKPQEKLKKTSQ
jgi:membrane protein DedA with SNARE-associated domain